MSQFNLFFVNAHSFSEIVAKKLKKFDAITFRTSN